MALSERLKQNLKSNTEWYNQQGDTPVTPEWGFPSTLDEVEKELQNRDITPEDKKILLDWMDAFQKIKIKNDSTAEARREKIKGDMIKLRGEAVMRPLPLETTRPISEALFDEAKIKVLKTALESEAKNPLSVETLSKTLDRLKEEKDPNNRAVITSYVWSKLTNSGFIMVIRDGKISLENPKDKINATALETTLSAYLSSKILSLSDLQRAMIVGPTSFGKYLDTQRVNINNVSTAGYAQFLANSYSIDLTRGDTPQQVQAINRSTATPEEKALLISHVSGGLKSYNITPEIERQVKLSAISAEIIASPAFQRTEKIVSAASSGGLKDEKQRRAKEGKPENLTMKELFDNPISAITTYPWASALLIIGSIFAIGWKNTFMGLIGIGIGMKAVNEVMDRSGHPIGGKNDPKDPDTDKKKPRKVQGETKAPDQTIDTSAKGPEEKKLFETLQRTPSITKVLNNRKEKLSTYVDFIDKNNLLDKTLGEIIYTNPHDQSIFANQPDLPSTITLPSGINAIILKRILRQLISGVDGYNLLTDPNGVQHTQKYKEWVLGQQNAGKVSDEEWKKKKIRDIVPEIAKKL